MLVVVALGGNALLRRGEPADVASQRANVAIAAKAIAALAREHEIVVTHGNGPQVGLLALQNEAFGEVAPYPLDVLGAESEGMIGYLLDQQLTNELEGRAVATLLTQVVVAADDPAFGAPSKPIGPTYDAATAQRLASERGWSVAPDGDRYRRVVASPEPRSIVELTALRVLVDAGVLVVCVGGGGIPVLVDEAGIMRGAEAVIDKDRTACLLAELLGADALLMLTDVASVFEGWGTPDAAPLRTVTPAALREMSFAPGSMGPKVEAGCRFVERTGGTAAIGALADAGAVLRGEHGTLIRA